MEKPQADWMSWVLHYIFGLVVGAGMAFGGGMRWNRFSSSTLDGDQLLIVLGSAFIGGGLASQFGDRFWSDSYRCIPPDEITHSQASKIASVFSWLVGSLLLFLGLIRVL